MQTRAQPQPKPAWSLAAPLLLLAMACAGAPDGEGSSGGASPNLADDHAGYLRSVAGAELELVEPGVEGAWREIRGGGRVVRLGAPPERIASRTLATDEILLAIAEHERIVLLSPFAADPDFSRSATEARRLGRVGGFSTEEILAASPDLVFAAGFNSEEALAQLEAAGVPVLVLLDHESLKAIENNIRVVGFATGRDLKAERLVESMRERLEEARARVGDRVEGLRVVHFSGGTVLAGRTVFDDVIRYLGAVNLATEEGLVGWPRISAEQVVVWNPDVIFTDTYVASDTATATLDGTRAARLGNVAELDGRDMAAISHHVVWLVDRVAAALLDAVDRLEAARGDGEAAVR